MSKITHNCYRGMINRATHLVTLGKQSGDIEAAINILNEIIGKLQSILDRRK